MKKEYITQVFDFDLFRLKSQKVVKIITDDTVG